jgi:hypothetical protein
LEHMELHEVAGGRPPLPICVTCRFPLAHLFQMTTLAFPLKPLLWR